MPVASAVTRALRVEWHCANVASELIVLSQEVLVQADRHSEVRFRRLLLFQGEGVNIVASYVAQQQRGVSRIQRHPNRIESRNMPIFEVGDTLPIAPGGVDSIHAPVAIFEEQKVNVLAIAGPRGVIHAFGHRQRRPSLRCDVEHLQTLG